MATAKKTKKQTSKKEEKEKLKLIPGSLLCSFIWIFLNSRSIHVNGFMIGSYEPIIEKMNKLGYNTWKVQFIPDEVFKINLDHQKTPTYRHYLEKFILDVFEIEIIKIKDNEYYINSTIDNSYYAQIVKGLKQLGFVTK